MYDNERYTYIDAQNIEDCIIQFADYMGCYDIDLFLKALKGCYTPKDYVDMYHRFNLYHINSILIIGQTVYDEKR